MDFKLDEFYKSIENMNKVVCEAVNSIRIDIPKLTGVINLIINEDDVAENMKGINKKLLINGWYITNETDVSILNDIMNETDINRIDEIMANASRHIVKNTYGRIKQNYPNRYNIIKDALDAHNNKLYTLSIPVILSQADGICKILFEVNLYSKDKSFNYEFPKTKKRRKNKIQENNKIIDAMFLYPLDILTNFNYGTKEQNNLKPLNRNSILHGSNLTYASEINSLKCIALLNYLLDIKEEYFDKKLSNDC